MTNNLCAFAENCDGNGATIVGNACAECVTNTARDIRALVYDFVDLTQLIPVERRIPTDAIHRPKPGPTMPVDTNILTLCDDIRVLLIHWERRLRIARTTEAVRAGYAVQRAADTVAPRVDIIAGITDADGVYGNGVDALLRLRELHRIARRRVGHHARTIALPGECPDRICRARTLTRKDGTDTVTCATCRASWAYADYQQYVTLRVTRIDALDERE